VRRSMRYAAASCSFPLLRSPDHPRPEAQALQHATSAVSELQAREHQIVSLLSSGKRNREIASALSLSEKTVKGDMTLLMQELHARNRLEAVIAVQSLSQATLRGDIESDGLAGLSG
ncbi:response regulator transcription factor, partial [Lysobacter sp. TAB13]|uniref:response regulator transcription factor n=1 Tax=Lysobacter sp. TAB13 TaxID=3233065 RepID=UPI003F9C7714